MADDAQARIALQRDAVAREQRGSFNRRFVDSYAKALLWRVEAEDGLPLPSREWDVVVDDPDMLARREYRRLTATTPLAAQVKAYRKAMREDGFRCMPGHPGGDEAALAIALDAAPMWAVVHQVGQHPQIDYSKPAPRIERVEAVPAT